MRLYCCCIQRPRLYRCKKLLLRRNLGGLRGVLCMSVFLWQVLTTRRTTTTTWARGARASTSWRTCTGPTSTSSCRAPGPRATRTFSQLSPTIVPTNRHNAAISGATLLHLPAGFHFVNTASLTLSNGRDCNSYQFYTTLFVVECLA